jgi:hypothetical protein
MIDARRKLLTEALGECWHEIAYTRANAFKCSCGEVFHHGEALEAKLHCKKLNRTFATADDYEALREKVIVPNAEKFVEYLELRPDGVLLFDRFAWWLTLSPEERNEIICDFGIDVLGWEVKK